jgi:hypothetical protein
MLRLLLVPILVSLLAVLGCKSTQSSDLAGTWVIKDDSRRILPTKLQNASGKLVLSANGTFAASDMPGLFTLPDGTRPDWKAEPGLGDLFRARESSNYNSTSRQLQTGKKLFHAAHNSTCLEVACTIFWEMQTRSAESHLKRSDKIGTVPDDSTLIMLCVSTSIPSLRDSIPLKRSYLQAIAC